MTDTTSVRASNLTGAALDWALAMAEGYTQDSKDHTCIISPQDEPISCTVRGAALGYGYRPSTSWTQGGPLIEKHRGGMSHEHRLADTEVRWSGGPAEMGYWCYGPTPLVAFCRSLVSLKLGRHVKVPKKLDIGLTT